MTKDVNYSDGSKPPTRIEIEGEFLLKDIGKWVDAAPDAVPNRGGS